jgi:hypothetical protein
MLKIKVYIQERHLSSPGKGMLSTVKASFVALPWSAPSCGVIFDAVLMVASLRPGWERDLRVSAHALLLIGFFSQPLPFIGRLDFCSGS